MMDKIRKYFAETIIENKMIVQNDKILVAFSGGKDSFVMLDLFMKLKKNAPVRFDMLAVIIDPGFGMDYTKAEKYLKNNYIPYLIKKSKISLVIKEKMPDEKKTGNYCFLCSRLRRGLLYKIAKENDCNKLALGHSLDDAIETYLMNIFFVSRKDIMRPKYMSKKNIAIIRPLIDLPEKNIIDYAKKNKFPIVKQVCNFKKTDSKRAMIKSMIKKLSKEKNFYGSMRTVLKKQNL